jgi:hypothetical protein
MPDPVTALARLRNLLMPFLTAALPSEKPAWAHLRIAADPLDVQLVSADPAGTERVAHAIVGQDVLGAVNGVLQAWYSTLPAAEVQALGARLEREAGKLWLVTDLGVTACTMLLETTADEAEIIGVLASDVVRH